MDWDNIVNGLLSFRTLGIGALVAISTKLVQDIAWYRFNLETLDQPGITKECYDLFEYMLPTIKQGESIDYSEGLFEFETKPDMKLEEATKNKYEYIYKQLGLKEGMTLLDAGCGSGVWIDFCRNKGVNVKGLTLSPEQAALVKNKGLDVEVWDYRIKRSDFIGRFDRITALGSTEHMCTTRGGLQYEDNESVANKRSVETLSNVWSVLRSYLKPEGKMFVTTLTINPQATWSTWDYFQTVALDQHYGGFYPLWTNIQKAALKANFNIEHNEDRTKDYHWSSMIEPKHFGYFTINWQENTWDKISYLIKNAITSPFRFPFHCLYQGLDTWMWQFGGPQTTPLTTEQVEKAPAQLKYFMMTPSAEHEIQSDLEETNTAVSNVSISQNTSSFFSLKRITPIAQAAVTLGAVAASVYMRSSSN